MVKNLSGNEHLTLDVGNEQQDELFEVLAHPRRRFALQYLQHANAAIPVDELTAEIAAWESERNASDRNGGSSDGIELSLVHTHLPKMADAEVVMYDAAAGTVSSAARDDEVRAQLRAMVLD